MTPASIRHNNPGGMKWAPWQAAFGGKPGAKSPDGSRYAYFDTPEAGFAAATNLQQRYESAGRSSIAQRVARWTGYQGGGKDSASKQQYQNYVTRLSRALGIDPNTPFSISDPNLGPKYLATMASVEAGRPSPFPQESLSAGFARGVGGVPVPPLNVGQTAQGKQMPLGMGRGQIKSGPAVRQLQQQLTDAGFNVGPHGIDGRFGKDTAAAVRQAEQQYGLTPDRGVAGPQVQSALAGIGRTQDITSAARLNPPGGTISPDVSSTDIGFGRTQMPWDLPASGAPGGPSFGVGAGTMPGAGAVPSGYAGRGDMTARPKAVSARGSPLYTGIPPSSGPLGSAYTAQPDPYTQAKISAMPAPPVAPDGVPVQDQAAFDRSRFASQPYTDERPVQFGPNLGKSKGSTSYGGVTFGDPGKSKGSVTYGDPEIGFAQPADFQLSADLTPSGPDAPVPPMDIGSPAYRYAVAAANRARPHNQQANAVRDRYAAAAQPLQVPGAPPSSPAGPGGYPTAWGEQPQPAASPAVGGVPSDAVLAGQSGLNDLRITTSGLSSLGRKMDYPPAPQPGQQSSLGGYPRYAGGPSLESLPNVTSFDRMLDGPPVGPQDDIGDSSRPANQPVLFPSTPPMGISSDYGTAIPRDSSSSDYGRLPPQFYAPGYEPFRSGAKPSVYASAGDFSGSDSADTLVGNDGAAWPMVSADPSRQAAMEALRAQPAPLSESDLAARNYGYAPGAARESDMRFLAAMGNVGHFTPAFYQGRQSQNVEDRRGVPYQPTSDSGRGFGGLPVASGGMGSPSLGFGPRSPAASAPVSAPAFSGASVDRFGADFSPPVSGVSFMNGAPQGVPGVWAAGDPGGPGVMPAGDPPADSPGLMAGYDPQTGRFADRADTGGLSQPARVAARGAIGPVPYVKPQSVAQRAGGVALGVGANALLGPLGGILARVLYNSATRGSFDKTSQYTTGPGTSYDRAAPNPYGGYTTGSSYSASPFTPAGYTAPNFSPVSGGSLYAYQPNGQGGGSYVDSQGRVHSY